MVKVANKKHVKEAGEEAVLIASELDRFVALDNLAKSEGGKELVFALLSDIVDNFDTLALKYKTMEHQEMQGICASIASKLDIYRAITGAGKLRKVAKEDLEKALKGGQ